MQPLYIITLLLLTGCSTFIPSAVEPIEIPSQFKESTSVTNKNLNPDWWKNFKDDNLNNLVELALHHNLSYKIALKDAQMAESESDILEDIAAAKAREAKLMLISQVANAYFQLAALNSSMINLSQQLDISTKLVKVANTQYQTGYIDSTSLRDIQTQENAAKNALDNLKKEQNVLLYTLANLLGQYPEDFNVQIAPLPIEAQFNQLIPPADPVQVMINRPDIQIAILEVKTTSNEDQYEIAMLNYQNTVYQAFQEVDDALLSYKEDQNNLYNLKIIENNASADFKSAQTQYHAGQIDYASYLNSKALFLQSKYNLINQNLLLYKDVIQIYQTLGLL